ncbi:epoxide hydrolase family protein [Nonomuraea sp. NPDC050536]|uniref:epoxide hydrolase family protein n=1 Tax=Nonomuraea sp. NPDC050536 TaxID=3364366 RepID=UPI0037C86DEB
MKAFLIDVPRAALDDLAGRLKGIEEPGLAAYWRDRYDWRAWEARLNAHPQFTTEIDGQRIHFLHVRSASPGAFPLILTHGWPGSVVEYLDLIEPLAGYDLVIPALPGFGFSGPATGWDRHRTAGAWAELMRRLGYGRYGAVGNDLGTFVSLELGRLDPGHVAGVHVTQVFSLPDGGPLELAPEDAERLRADREFITRRGAYLSVHALQPEIVAPALDDSPAGLLAWNGQLFGEAVSADFALTNVTLYWLTGTGGSAIRFYHEDARAPHPAEPTAFPIAVSEFTGDIFRSIQALARRDHANIVSWRTHEGGGHYAAHQAPQTLADDIHAFFDGLR